MHFTDDTKRLQQRNCLGVISLTLRRTVLGLGQHSLNDRFGKPYGILVAGAEGMGQGKLVG